MDPVYSAVLALTKSCLTDTPYEAEISLSDWERILSVAEWQGLVSIIYRAVRISHLSVPKEYLTRLKTGFLMDVRTDRFQRSELDRIFRVFEERGID